MIMHYIKLVFFVISLSACMDSTPGSDPTDEPVTSTFAPLRIGMLQEEIDAAGLVTERRVVSFEDEPLEEITVKRPQGTVVIVLSKGKIFELSTTFAGFRTKRNAKVGNTLDDLAALYPEGRIVKGFEDGGYLNFVLEEEPGVFEFDVGQLSRECLSNDKSCPQDLTKRKSVRFYLRR